MSANERRAKPAGAADWILPIDRLAKYESECRPAAARGNRARHPVLDDPTLIFRVNRRQTRVVAENLAHAVLSQLVKDVLVNKAKLSAGGVSFPKDDASGNIFVYGHRAERSV